MTSLQPQVVPAPPVRLGGLSPEVMLFAVLLVLPALWHSVVEGDLPLMVVLERYIFIVVGCSILGTLVQRYSESAAAVSQRMGRLEGAPAKTPAKAAAPASRPAVDPFALDEPDLAVPATGAPDQGMDLGAAYDADPLPDLGSLDDIDPLDLLSDESAEELPATFSLFDE